MNRLLAFYYGSLPDHRGRMLAEILQQDDVWLEATHDYIQWLFPLDEPSRVTPDAPLVDGETGRLFRTDEILQRHLRAALVRMLRFFGLRFDGTNLRQADNWPQRKTEWFTQSTHNSLRITRILKSMMLLGLQRDAIALAAGLEQLCETDPECGVSAESRIHWREAVKRQGDR